MNDDDFGREKWVMEKLQPVIKWSGSKRSQLENILEHIPTNIETYIEPFVGGGSVFGGMLVRGGVGKFIINDLNTCLIELWTLIRDNPDKILNHYEDLWTQLNSSSSPEDVFYYTRDSLNHHNLPEDFMFILRTCVNGMPRYNSKGHFNTSFHHNRGGMKPETLRKIVYKWHTLMKRYDITFTNSSYEGVYSKKGGFMYLDPPYANTKGMYFGGLDVNTFFNWLGSQEGDWILSYDGVSGDVDSTYDVPTTLYTEHKYLKSGNSSFKRTMQGNSDSVVYESLYIK